MLLKWKIYLGIAIIILGIFVYQFIVIRNLKGELHNSTNTISILELNELALKDSLGFKPDSIAILHTFIKDKDALNKELKEMYNSIKGKSEKEIKKLNNQVALLSGEIKIKDKTIDSLKILIESGTITTTDSTINIPILYDSKPMGLSLNGVAVGNFIDKTGYIFWNKIKVSMPTMRIGLVYEPADSTIVAMIESNDSIATFKTTMSDELYKLIVDNVLPQPSWMDYVSFYSECSYSGMYYVNLGVSVFYRNFYVGAGRSFAVQYDFNGAYYSVGYSMSLSEIIGKIR